MRRTEKPSFKRRYAAGGILFGSAVILLLITRYIPGTADWYSTHIYAFLVETVARLTGLFSFSAVEILLYLLFVFLLIRLVWFFIRLKRKQVHIKESLIGSGSVIVLFAGCLFLSYMMACGANYYRESFSAVNNMEPGEYTKEQLAGLIESLTEQVNQYAAQVERDENGLCVNHDNVQQQAVSAMQQLAEDYSCLSGYYPLPKGLIVSEFLSYQQLSGIYLPFTIEANYNADMMDYNIPFTACHELSHLRGFMREDEANYIAYLACTNSEETIFQYSGNLVAWIHSMNALYRIDPDLHAELYTGLAETAAADLRANSAFWKSYDGKIAETADKINDTYLKANNQKDGVQSYGRMVDLILYQYLQDQE